MEKKTALWLLAVGNAFAIWSAFNPSFFTLRKFVDREGTAQDRRDAIIGMVAAGVVIGMMFWAVAVIAKNDR